jgi:hypothetical protein
MLQKVGITWPAHPDLTPRDRQVSALYGDHLIREGCVNVRVLSVGTSSSPCSSGAGRLPVLMVNMQTGMLNKAMQYDHALRARG